ncbi:type II toxin-antitoxin system RelB/DinJ family antitoxin [Fusobacterium varium]
MSPADIPAVINVITDEETKKKLESLFDDTSMGITVACNIFIETILIREQGLPEVCCKRTHNLKDLKTLAVINIATNEKTKKKFESLCNNLRMSMSKVCSILIETMLREQGFPEVCCKNPPNLEELAAIKEAKKNAKDHNVKSYKTAEEAFKVILGDDY